MSNIGFDFGTTYSVVAAAKDAAGGDFTPTAKLLFDEAYSPFYDSLAVKGPNGKITYGYPARRHMNLNGSRSYKGFKMLLAEDDDATLMARGYEDKLRPDDIVKGYISDLLTRYTERYDSIDNLVIGVPEIWVENSVKQKCYERLYDIVTGLNIAKDVILVSEPTCACAYYVSKYKEVCNGAEFEGNILIVDYGGGTLDIALCSVEIVEGKPKVTVIKRSGAGANEEGVIGKAGFAFMEEVVRLALAAGKQPKEVIEAEENKSAIYDCIYALEDSFKALSSARRDDEWSNAFKETFSARGSLERHFTNETHFATIKFSFETEIAGGDKITASREYPVTYGMIAQAFAEKIRPVLEDKLNVIIQYMKEHHIDYGFNSDHFKIQLVGGFCNFLLVQNTVDNALGRAAAGKDKRYIGELPTSDDRTMAVAYGAALLANEQTSYGFMSQFAFGLPVKFNNTDEILWSIRKDVELVFNKVYLFKVNDTNAAVIGAEGISEFVYEGDYGAIPTKLDEKYAKMLRMNADNHRGYIMGISQDRSRIITFHWWEVKDSIKITKILGLLEGLIEAGTPISELGAERSERLNKVLKLGGNGPVILTR